MPDLEYQASVAPEPLPGRPFPHLPQEMPPAVFGGEVGRAVEYAGSEVEQHVKAAVAQARQTQLTDAHNQLQALSLGLTHDPKNGAFTKQGKDAFGISDQYLPKFDEQAAQIIAGVPDERARQAATLAAAQVRDHLSEQLDTHEIEQHRRFGIQTAQSSIKLAGQVAAANYNHPDILAAQRDHMDASLDSLGQQMGWSKEELDEARQEAHSNLHTDVLERMLGDDKDQMASVYLRAHKDELDARTYETLSAHIEAKNKEKLNEAKQDIRDRYEDSLKGAEYGLPNAIQVTRKEMDILYPKDPQRRWDELTIMQRAGAKAREYDQMTPDQIQADLAASKPKEGAPEALYQIEGQSIRERAAERSIKERVADPAGFAVSRGNWQPLDWRNPQSALAQLQARSRTQGELGDQIGVPVPILTKPEAKQVAGSLENASPENAAAMLAQLSRALPGQAFDSLLDQVAPHSPVLAVAGSFLDTPAKVKEPAWYDPKLAAPDKAASVAEGIINGERIISGKGEEKVGGGFQLPPDNDGAKPGLLTYFNQEAGGRSNTLFAGRPQSAELYYRAFKAYYAHLASQAGRMSGDVDPGLARSAASAVLGDVGRFNHTDVAVPRGMDPAQFETIARTGVEQAAKAAGFDQRMATHLSENGGLAEVTGALGTGRYAVIDGNGNTIRQKDGHALTLDLSRVKVPEKGPQAEVESALLERWSNPSEF